MSFDAEQSAQLINDIADEECPPGLLNEPSTPRDDDFLEPTSQQTTLPSTEGPNSPIDPAASFKTELNDDLADTTIIPSSLTPPPSSQVPNLVGAGALNPLSYVASQRSSVYSPPATGLNGLLNGLRRGGAGGGTEFSPPAPQQVADASADELRTMLHACIAEDAKFKMEAAHHKLQYSLLSIQADEDMKRAAVEHDMIRKEVEALQMAESSRRARRELSATSDTNQAKYQQLKGWYEKLLEENEVLQKKVKAARKVISGKQDEICSLTDERDMLLNRIRENREHFHHLCSPGGMFHGAITPKTAPTAVTPVQHRATPRQTPKSLPREMRVDQDHSKENFAVLLQALSQDNNSAPSTPLAGQRPAARTSSKHHTRNVQSMSSLPTTPTARSRLDKGGLLPSVNLVPQTEPPYRISRFIPETPPPGRSRERRKSRESTISAEDNEELARQALQVASFASRASQNPRSSRRQPVAAAQQEEAEEEVFESQASQAASEMLRRDPRESFEVASSVGNSRDVTPTPIDKSAKLQAKLIGGLIKSGVATAEKRKFSSGQHGDGRDDATDQLSQILDQQTHPPTMASTSSLPRGLKAVLSKSPTDVVILSSLRTPICRSYKGQLKDAYPEELLSVVLRATLDANPNLDPSAIDDVAVGVVLSSLGGSKAARMAMNHAGFPSTTSLYTVNRACSSSLQAIANIGAQIRTDTIAVGIGAGMESMTRNYGSRAIPVDLWPALKTSPVQDARDCIMPMGLTSENVAARYNVSRADQDAFAVESHVRAARARAAGYFSDEIAPVATRFQQVDKSGAKVGEEQTITAREDDGIRAGVTLEALAKLKPAFAADGASTAGNSSQVSDGAAATLLMRRSTATALGLTDSIMGKFVGTAVVGCKPDEMGIGPALAIPKLLGQLGLSTADVDRWEINEAFASQAIHCVRELGLEKDWVEGRVNPDGGAIALGHPLGATGARLVSTLMHGLRRTGGEVGVVSMCIGTGMGMGGLFVRE
ncbi:Thiolase, N-terminal domain-containing protein [Bombardia bombarda]|uniref:acetyl-CoA C-acyltransferase n=1 Tax=Bombardia bombarda TaxID=252184 RepID=A0AA40BVX1_9PEZI|nr:Thiolase, N-terminal domain-containing protein [Bombardia bombarda]